MKQTILSFLIVFFLLSCSPDVRFEEPQPTGKRNLREFSKKYRGEYLNLNDSSVLIIDSKKITRHWKQFTTILKDSLFAELDTVFEHDTVLQLGDHWQIDIKFIGDSAKLKSDRLQTVFAISQKYKLRKFKGYLFLNYYLTENVWDVEVLKQNNGSLIFEKLVYASDIDTLAEIINIETITDTLTDEIQEYILKPKRKELKKILNAKQAGRTYKKMN